jgi:hypothetical protein
LTLDFIIEVNGHSSWDFVYYELAAGDGILLDWVIIEIGNGQNWYTVFNWYDNNPDTNTNMDFTIFVPPIPSPNEPDQRDILASYLYNSGSYSTGVAIDLDSKVPPGTYLYLRISAPPWDSDGQLEIDAIQVLP